MCDHKSRAKKALDLGYGDKHTMIMVVRQNAEAIEQRDYMHHCQKEEGNRETGKELCRVHWACRVFLRDK